MRAYFGGGWYVSHLTDRVVEIRKESAIYRQLTGRDGFVRVRAEPGMSRADLIDTAIALAVTNDEMITTLAAKRIFPKHLTRYRLQQHKLAHVFGVKDEEKREYRV
jgi:hypothetical protein